MSDSKDPAPATAPSAGSAPVPIALLPLSVRAINRLHIMGIEFESDLHRINLDDFARVNGVGRKTLSEVRRVSGASFSTVAVPPPPPIVIAPPEIWTERLEVLNWSTRTGRCLKKANILLVRDLASATPESLLTIKNFGRRCLREVNQKLGAMGLTLRMQFAQAKTSTSTPAAGVISPGQKLLLREARAVKMMPDSRDIRRGDPRLRTELVMFTTGGADLREKAELLLSETTPSPQAETLAHQLKTLRALVVALSREHLEDELLEILKSTARPRYAEMTARRLGWDGRGGATLEVTGSEFGVTRERARQVCTKIASSLRSNRPFAPALDHAIAIVKSLTPATREQLEAALVAEGVARSTFQLEGLLSAARLLGREPFFADPAFPAVRTVADLTGSRIYVSLSRIAANSVRRWGAATVSDVTAQAAKKSGVTLSPELVQRALQGLHGFRWLDESTGWFWLQDLRRNRLWNQIRKVLAVAPEISVGELRRAVGRHHRMKGFSPPRRVLLELCSQLQDCKVTDNSVAANPPLDWTKILAGSERTMARVLKELGPIMTREDFEAKCRAAGMKKSTFYVYLTYSPIIVRYLRGVYGLPGSNVAPGLVESLAPRSRQSRVLKDYGWTSDGRVWVDYELSQATIGNGVISLPAGMRKLLQGRFTLKTEDGADVGALVTKANQAWGLLPLFRRRGGDRGDHLLLVINLSNRTAVAMIGGTDIVERIEIREDGLVAVPR